MWGWFPVCTFLVYHNSWSGSFIKITSLKKNKDIRTIPASQSNTEKQNTIKKKKKSFESFVYVQNFSVLSYSSLTILMMNFWFVCLLALFCLFVFSWDKTAEICKDIFKSTMVSGFCGSCVLAESVFSSYLSLNQLS